MDVTSRLDRLLYEPNHGNWTLYPLTEKANKALEIGHIAGRRGHRDDILSDSRQLATKLS